jgi:S-methylmethionine-dependent homocysteine/selenocysteine methylase
VIDEAGRPGDGYRAQAEIIADVGVDLIMLEMMRDVTQTRLCLEAALETGLPVWPGFSVERSPDGVFEIPNWRFDNTLSPEEFAAAAMEWVDRGAGAVGGCCGIRPAHIAALGTPTISAGGPDPPTGVTARVGHRRAKTVY